MNEELGVYKIKDIEDYRWYWMGKSPLVKNAVEEYLTKVHKRIINGDISYDETQSGIALKYGVSTQIVGYHFRTLKRTELIELNDKKLYEILKESLPLRNEDILKIIDLNKELF